MRWVRWSNMGQQLFEPPDVAGWDLGTNWFSSGAMLTRMNFASQLATNQKFDLRDLARGARQSPEALVVVHARSADRRAICPRAVPGARSTTCAPAGRGPDRTRSCSTKAAGLAHLIVGSGDYQLV